MASAVKSPRKEVKNETTYDDYDDFGEFSGEEDMFMMEGSEVKNETTYDDYDDDDFSLTVNPNNIRNKNQQNKEDKHVIEEKMLKLKKPPVYTERTVSLISASAPHSEFENFMKASLKTVVSPKLSSQSKDTKQKNSPEFKAVMSRKTLLNLRNNNINNNNNNNIMIKENFLEGHNTHLLRVSEDDEVVGSLPHTKFMDHIILRSAREKSEGKDIKRKATPDTNQYGKFITISTLSFTNYLSPETPYIELGNPNAKHRVLISCAVHGDEPCGFIAFNELLSEGYFHNLSSDIHITGIVGNPAAVVQKKRFIEYNLNRMIREDLFRKRSYESERARVLADAITKCDILLDLHSCSAHAPAHALPAGEPRSVALAKQMPVGYVIKELVHTTPGKATTIDWAVKYNKMGICVECGQHEERQTIDNARLSIVRMIELIVGLEPSFQIEPPIILNCYENEPVRKGFKFARKIDAFDFVEHGEVIARDDIVGNIYSKYKTGTYIVMPTKKPVLGEEAFFYAERSS